MGRSQGDGPFIDCSIETNRLIKNRKTFGTHRSLFLAASVFVILCGPASRRSHCGMRPVVVGPFVLHAPVCNSSPGKKTMTGIEVSHVM